MRHEIALLTQIGWELMAIIFMLAGIVLLIAWGVTILIWLPRRLGR